MVKPLELVSLAECTLNTGLTFGLIRLHKVHDGKGCAQNEASQSNQKQSPVHGHQFPFV